MKTINQKLLDSYVQDPDNPENNFALGIEYHSVGQLASAVSFFTRAAERSDSKELQYECLLRAALCFIAQGTRGLSVRGLLSRAITVLPTRPEAYFLLSRWYEREQTVESWVNCYTYASIAEKVCDFNSPPLRTDVEYPGKYGILFEKAVSSWWVGLCDDSRDMFKDLLINHKLDRTHRQAVINNLSFMNEMVTKEITKYDSSKFHRAKTPFSGWEQVRENFSEAYQDMFVLTASGGKRNGTYLEIGAGNPVYGNNTWLLESEFGWKGISIDFCKELVDEWPKHGRTCLHANALTVDYADLLKDMPDCIDYLQVDIDPADVSLQALEKILNTSGKIFAAVTFEHDAYCQIDNSVQLKAEKLLKDRGYICVVKNVAPDSWRNYEDWWVHSSAITSSNWAATADIMGIADRSDASKRAETIFLVP